MLQRSQLPEFVIVSVILHSLLVVIVSLTKAKSAAKEQIVVEIQSTPATRQKVPVRIKQPITQSQQIVQQDNQKTDLPVPKTNFVSSENHVTKKQTVSKNTGVFKNSQKSAVKKVNSNQLKIKSHENADTLVKAEDSHEAEANQSADMIKDVDEGLETLLNTREFKLYTYYNRIRVQLSEHWESNVKSKVSQMLKNGRSLSSVDHMTKLLVILDRNGNLLKVQILEESGVSDLDDAVTEAFQSASPFPEPPAGLIEPDGTVKIRWDFLLEG